MDIISSNQSSLDELAASHFDVMILGYCQHERWNSLLDKISKNADRRILFLFKDADSLFCGEDCCGEIKLPDYDTIMRFRGNDSSGIEDFISNLIKSFRGKFLRLLIDYSSMSRPWYAAIVKALLQTEPEQELQVLVYFVATPPSYFAPPELTNVGRESAMLAHSNVSSGKKIALIMGLGYEANPAQKLVAKLKPDQIFLFYADPPFHPLFLENVLKMNKKLIRKAKKDRIIKYPVHDLEKTDQLLSSLVILLRQTHHVIIVPLGPKVFAMNSLLVQARYPDVEVWDAGFEAWIGASEIRANGDQIVYKLEFAGE